MQRRSWVGVFTASLLCSAVGVPSLEASPALVMVGEQIHADVSEAKLGDVLKVLADKAGLRIVWRGSPSETVAFRWRGISVQDAVRDLLRTRDFLLVYEPTSSGGSILSEVWVFGSADSSLTELGGQRIARAETRSGEQPRRTRAREGSVAARVDELRQLTIELQQQGDTTRLTELLRERINDPDPQIQMFVFSALTHSPDPRATRILAEVVRQDSDLARRRMAASGLRQRGGAESVAALAQVAREDPDSHVRRELLVILGRMGRAAVPALAQAANDSDPDVAQIAQHLLKKVTRNR